jgi:hypothetical protein
MSRLNGWRYCLVSERLSIRFRLKCFVVFFNRFWKMAVYPDWQENVVCKLPKLLPSDWRCKLVRRGRSRILIRLADRTRPTAPLMYRYVTYNYCRTAIRGERPKPRSTAPQPLFNVSSLFCRSMGVNSSN